MVGQRWDSAGRCAGTQKAKVEEMKRLFFVVLAIQCTVACGTAGSDNENGGAGGAEAAGGFSGGQGGSGLVRDCEPNVAPECVNDMCRPENRDCGAPSSVLDENGCYRATCATNDDCAAQEECREVTYSPVACGYAPPNESVCSCGGLGVALTESRCFPRAQ